MNTDSSKYTNLAVPLGRKLRLSGKEIEALRLGGILHDIGKIWNSKKDSK